MTADDYMLEFQKRDQGCSGRPMIYEEDSKLGKIVEVTVDMLIAELLRKKSK